jgi:glyoxalase family protein
MIAAITGLHHITAMASDARRTDAFHTEMLGLRRIKKTVNFDAPDIYHLYYGDRIGTPGSVMTYFPFSDIGTARRGTGEVGSVTYAVPEGALDAWRGRHPDAATDTAFGQARLHLAGPDGEAVMVVEGGGAPDTAWTGSLDDGSAPTGFHSAALRVADAAPRDALLRLMGYAPEGRDGTVTRYRTGDRASPVDLDLRPDLPPATQGAGSVHHIAFAVPDRAAQLGVRAALTDAGYQVTPVIDRQYFWAIYFRTPSGILFEIATDEPGFAVDEDAARLGEALVLPPQHEHLRERLERTLVPLP